MHDMVQTEVVALKSQLTKIDMNFYSQKFIRCEYNYNTPTNRHCLYQDFESQMIDTKYGKVCWPCHRIIEIGENAKQDVLLKLVNY